MKRLFIFVRVVAIMVSITLISCGKDHNKCDVLSPAEELDWLKEAIDSNLGFLQNELDINQYYSRPYFL